MTNRKRCAGRNSSGEPCGAPPVRDSPYCYFHDPALAEARERARDLGHARQRRDATLAQIYGFTTLSTTDGKHQLLDIAAHDTLALDNSVPRNRALAGMVQTSIKVDEYTELKGRVEQLEAAVKAHRDEHSVYEETDELGDHFDLPGGTLVTALDRRLQKVAEARSPTEAVVRWLEEAKGNDSYASFTSALVDHPSLNPYTAIPPVVASWAGHTDSRRTSRAASERIERAVERGVRSALVRVSLVERQNSLLTMASQGDGHQLDLLQMLRPLVLTGRVDRATEGQWVEHAGRLVDEAWLWWEGAERIGSRYLADQSPLFPDVETYLVELKAGAEELLLAYNAAAQRTRGRKPKGEPLDLSLIDEHVTELLEAHAESLVRQARMEIEVFLGERDRQLTIPRLIELGAGSA